jgi:hypothetical protein
MRYLPSFMPPIILAPSLLQILTSLTWLEIYSCNFQLALLSERMGERALYLGRKVTTD